MPTGRENIPVSRFEFWAEIRNQDVDVSAQIRMDCRATQPLAEAFVGRRLPPVEWDSMKSLRRKTSGSS